MTITLSQCMVCIRFRGEDRSKNACDAYPGGIPLPIWENRDDHREPQEGDQGLRFLHIPGAFPHPLSRS